MSEWINLIAPEAVPEGEGITVKGPDGHEYAIFRVNGTFHALDNTCCHQGGPLGEGFVEDGLVSCPWHGWQFRLENGECLDFPDECVRAYPVRVEGGQVQVQL